MEDIIFAESMKGLAIERIIRQKEYSMKSRHMHRTYEIYFLLEGERYFFIGKETYHIRAGTVVLIRRDQIHKTSIVGIPYHDRILLQIDADLLDTYLKSQNLPKTEEYFTYLSGAMKPSEEEFTRLCGLCSRIREELSGKRKDYELIVKQNLTEMLVLLYRHKNQEDTEEVRYEMRVEDHKYQKVNEIAEYLTTHCETRESLEELSKRFYISKSYLTRIFKEVTGLTVREYANAVRVRRAKHYLRHSEHSITEIAQETGFDSITYFERVFKRYADVSPLRYRSHAAD